MRHDELPTERSKKSVRLSPKECRIVRVAVLPLPGLPLRGLLISRRYPSKLRSKTIEM